MQSEVKVSRRQRREQVRDKVYATFATQRQRTVRDICQATCLTPQAVVHALRVLESQGSTYRVDEGVYAVPVGSSAE